MSYRPGCREISLQRYSLAVLTASRQGLPDLTCCALLALYIHRSYNNFVRISASLLLAAPAVIVVFFSQVLVGR